VEATPQGRPHRRPLPNSTCGGLPGLVDRSPAALLLRTRAACPARRHMSRGMRRRWERRPCRRGARAAGPFPTRHAAAYQVPSASPLPPWRRKNGKRETYMWAHYEGYIKPFSRKPCVWGVGGRTRAKQNVCSINSIVQLLHDGVGRPEWQKIK
jgi:hypothetical protein